MCTYILNHISAVMCVISDCRYGCVIQLYLVLIITPAESGVTISIHAHCNLLHLLSYLSQG